MKKVKIELYEVEILLFSSVSDMQRWMKKNCTLEDTSDMVEFADGTEGLAGVIPTNDGKCYFFITLSSLDIITLCHESLHIAYMVLDAVGVRHDITNHESLCYLQHHIFKKCGKKFGLI